MKGVTSFACVAVAVLCFSACMESDNGLAKALYRSAEAAIMNGDQAVRVSQVTQFDWDKLFIYGPYTSVDRIYTQLGYQWPDAERTGIEYSETEFLLVFVKDGKVVAHSKFSRSLGDWEDLERGNEFTKETAVFAVKHGTDTASKRLLFRPKRESNPPRAFLSKR